MSQEEQDQEMSKIRRNRSSSQNNQSTERYLPGGELAIGEPT